MLWDALSLLRNPLLVRKGCCFKNACVIAIPLQLCQMQFSNKKPFRCFQADKMRSWLGQSNVTGESCHLNCHRLLKTCQVNEITSEATLISCAQSQAQMHLDGVLSSCFSCGNFTAPGSDCKADFHIQDQPAFGPELQQPRTGSHCDMLDTDSSPAWRCAGRTEPYLGNHCDVPGRCQGFGNSTNQRNFQLESCCFLR